MLAPNRRHTTGALARLLDAQMATTGWCHAVMNTELNTLERKPDWYDDIQDDLDTAQKRANGWVNDLGPEVSSRVPEALIGFADRFEAAVEPMQRIVQRVEGRSGDQPTSGQKAELLQLVGSLHEVATSHREEVDQFDQQYRDFHQQLKAPLGAMRDEAKKVAHDMKLEEDKVADLKRSIRDIQSEIELIGDKISQEQITGASSVTKTTVGAVVRVSSFVYAGGTLSSVFGLGTAVFAIGKSVAIGAFYEGQLRDDVKRLFKKLDALEDEQLQAMGLQILDRSLAALFESAADMNDQLPYLQTVWTEVVLRLEAVRLALQQPTVDLSTVDALSNLDEAKDAWASIRKYAQNFQQIHLKHETESPIEIPTREDARRWAGGA